MNPERALRILDQLLGRCPMSDAERFAALAAFDALRGAVAAAAAAAPAPADSVGPA